MNYLFYIEPLTEIESPRWKAGWIKRAERLKKALSTHSSPKDTDSFYYLVGDGLEDYCATELQQHEYGIIDHTSLVPRFGNSALQVASMWQNESHSEDQLESMAELVREKANGFCPDVCITFSASPFLAKAFPDSTVFHTELGMLSRPPYPETMYFDPYGLFNNSVLKRFRNQLLQYSCSDEERHFLTTVQSKYTQLLRNVNPLSSYIESELHQYQKAVLVVLQFSNFYGYDVHAQFIDQYDLLLQSLKNTPSDVAVLVSQHPEHDVLRGDTFHFLKKKYPNLIWDIEIDQIAYASHFLMDYADLVITVSSSVGMQAGLWGKHLVVPGNSHLDTVSSSNDLKDVRKLLSESPPDQSSIFCWLLTRYYIPSNCLYSGGINTYFEMVMQNEPLEFSDFKPVVNPDVLLESYLEAIELWQDKPGHYKETGAKEEYLLQQKVSDLEQGIIDQKEENKGLKKWNESLKKEIEALNLNFQQEKKALTLELDQAYGQLGIVREEKYGLLEALTNDRFLAVETVLTLVDRVSKLSNTKDNSDEQRDEIRSRTKMLCELLRKQATFDVDYYLMQNPDVAEGGMDPMLHFVLHGWKEGRNPNEHTDIIAVSMENLQEIARGRHAIEFLNKPPQSIDTVPSEHASFDDSDSRTGWLGIKEAASMFEPQQPLNDKDFSAKLIAFYLPQFHPFPENDRFWGKGFTEWTNCSKARPVFDGHAQPFLPGELGFYDLRLPEVQYRQIELAKAHGIEGFCFHHYWFNGQKIMRKPLDQFFDHKDMDFKFCIHWANEPWTAKWDGKKQSGILLDQNHTPEDDQAFIEDITPFLRDERYITVDGRPLLLIYRPNLFPDMRSTLDRWKEYCHKQGIAEPFMAMLQTNFCNPDPREFGFDAAVEFPPLNFEFKHVPEQVQNLKRDFAGSILSYPSLVEESLSRPKPPYTCFRGVTPSWDNTPRNQNSSSIFVGSDPVLYQDWLEGIISYNSEYMSEDQQFIFINAWNEWAEGAYLEPDARNGYAYLNATSRALTNASQKQTPGKWTILFVTHDTEMGGAQRVLLEYIRWVAAHTNCTIKILALKGGKWLKDFQACGSVLVLSDLQKVLRSFKDIQYRIKRFAGTSLKAIYVNSVGSGSALKYFSGLGAPIITHFHELDYSINRYAEDHIDDLLASTDHFIACSHAVERNLIENWSVDRKDISVVHEFVEESDIASDNGSDHERQDSSKTFKVYASGLASYYRKGADLFIDVARNVRKKGHKDIHFYWLGEIFEDKSKSTNLWYGILQKMKDEGLDSMITFLGKKDDPHTYLREADVFLMTSREDPFPLVCLEAAQSGKPTICFDEAGGIPEFVQDDAGFVVPFCDTEAMADKVIYLAENEDERLKLGRQAKEKVKARHVTDRSADTLFHYTRQIAGMAPAVSIVIPNYNHAPYLRTRLNSIMSQQFRDFELIVLDDASTDESLQIITEFDVKPFIQVEVNTINSGSPFKQWLKGISLARSEIVWIAESDDYCEPDFLRTLLRRFSDPQVRLAYCDSYHVDENDVVGGLYSQGEYLNSVDGTKWRQNYLMSAEEEIHSSLGVKNTILNASGTLFRKKALSESDIKTIQNMNIAGDWLYYLLAIQGGRVAYIDRALNYHRRHSSSRVGSMRNNQKRRFFEEFFLVHSRLVSEGLIDSTLAERIIAAIQDLYGEFFPNAEQEDLDELYDTSIFESIINQADKQG